MHGVACVASVLRGMAPGTHKFFIHNAEAQWGTGAVLQVGKKRSLLHQLLSTKAQSPWTHCAVRGRSGSTQMSELPQEVPRVEVSSHRASSTATGHRAMGMAMLRPPLQAVTLQRMRLCALKRRRHRSTYSRKRTLFGFGNLVFENRERKSRGHSERVAHASRQS